MDDPEERLLQLDIHGLNRRFQDVKLDEAQLSTAPAEQVASALRDMETLLSVCKMQRESIDFRGNISSTTPTLDHRHTSGGISVGINRLVDQIRAEIGLYSTVLESSASDTCVIACQEIPNNAVDIHVLSDYGANSDKQSFSASHASRSRAATGISRRSSTFRRESVGSFSNRSDEESQCGFVGNVPSANILPPPLVWRPLRGINDYLFEHAFLETGSIQGFTVSRKYFVLSSDLGHLYFFDRNQKWIGSWQSSSKGISCFTFNEDCSLLAVGHDTGVITIIDTRNFNIKKMFDFNFGGIAKSQEKVISIRFASRRAIAAATNDSVSIAVMKESLFGHFMEVEFQYRGSNLQRYSKFVDMQLFRYDDETCLVILYDSQLVILARGDEKWHLIQEIIFDDKKIALGSIEISGSTALVTRSDRISVYTILDGGLKHIKDVSFEAHINAVKFLSPETLFCIYSNSEKARIIRTSDWRVLEEFDVNDLTFDVVEDYHRNNNSSIICDRKCVYVKSSRMLVGKPQSYHKRITNTMISHGLRTAIDVGLKIIRREAFTNDNTNEKEMLAFLESSMLQYLKVTADISSLTEAMSCCSDMVKYDVTIWEKVSLAAKELDLESHFYETCIEYVLSGHFRVLSTEMFQNILNHAYSKKFPDFGAIETLIIQTDIQVLDLDLAARICRKEKLLKCICHIQALILKDFWQPVAEYVDFYTNRGNCKHNLNDKHDLFIYLNLLLDNRSFPAGNHVEISDDEKSLLFEKLVGKYMARPQDAKFIHEHLIDFDMDGLCNLMIRFFSYFSRDAEKLQYFSNKLLNLIHGFQADSRYLSAMHIIFFGLCSRSEVDAFKKEDIMSVIFSFLKCDKLEIKNRYNLEKIIIGLNFWTDCLEEDLTSAIAASKSGKYFLICSFLYWKMGKIVESFETILKSQSLAHSCVDFLDAISLRPTIIPKVFEDSKNLKPRSLSSAAFDLIRKLVISNVRVFIENDAAKFVEIVDRVEPCFYLEIATGLKKSDPENMFHFIKNYMAYSQCTRDPLIDRGMYTCFLQLMASYEPSRLKEQLTNTTLGYDELVIMQECRRLRLIEPFIWLCNESGQYSDAVTEAALACEQVLTKLLHAHKADGKLEQAIFERKLSRLELIARLAVKSCSKAGNLTFWITLLTPFYIYRDLLFQYKGDIQHVITYILYRLSDCEQLLSSEADLVAILTGAGFDIAVITEISTILFQGYDKGILQFKTLIKTSRFDYFEMLESQKNADRNAMPCSVYSRCELCLGPVNPLLTTDISKMMMSKFLDEKLPTVDITTIFFACRHSCHLACFRISGYVETACPICRVPYFDYDL